MKKDAVDRNKETHKLESTLPRCICTVRGEAMLTKVRGGGRWR